MIKKILNDTGISERITRLRIQKGLTQEEAAKAIGIKYATYVKYEQGNHPSRKNLEIIANFYGCSKFWLLSGIGEPESKFNIQISMDGKSTISDEIAKNYIVLSNLNKRIEKIGYVDSVYRILSWIFIRETRDVLEKSFPAPSLKEGEFEELVNEFSNINEGMSKMVSRVDVCFTPHSLLELIKWVHEQK